MPVYKRGNSYTVRVQLNPDPATGKRREASKGRFKTKKGAKEYEVEWLIRIRRGEHVPPEKSTVLEFLNQWLDACKNSLSPTTHRRYEGIVKTHIAAHFGATPLQRLQPYEIQAMYNRLQDKLSPASVLYVHRVLHRALGQAVKWQVLLRNPAAIVEAPKIRQQERSVLSVAQTWIVLDESPEHLYIPILLAVTTGMRRGEIAALKWSDVDFDTGVLRVCRAMRYTDEGFKESTTKTDKSRRTIAITPGIVLALKKHRTTQKQNRWQLREGYFETGYICVWPDGRSLSPDVITKGFSRLAGKLGYNVTFHDLRHTHATMLFELGVPIKTVSERLGHSTTRLTQDTYTHVLPHMQEKAARIFDELFFRKA